MDWRAWYHQTIRDAIEVYWPRAMREPYTRFYVWTRPGSIVIAPDCPDGHQIATPEPVPVSVSMDGLKVWMVEKLKNAPCIPENL